MLTVGRSGPRLPLTMKMPTLRLALSAALLFVSPLAAQNNPAPSATKAKLKAVLVPKLDFRDATVREALEFLRMRSVALDTEGKGVNIILKMPGITTTSDAPPVPTGTVGASGASVPAIGTPTGRVTLTLNNVPLGEAINYVSKLVDGAVRVDPYAVVITLPEKGKKAGEAPRSEVPIADGVKMDKSVKPLQVTKLPKIDVREATVSEAFDFISQRAKALLPNGGALNIVLKGTDIGNRRVTFSGTDLPIIEALRYTAELADLNLAIEEFAVVVSEKSK